MERITVYITLHQKNMIETVARNTGVTFAETLRTALTFWGKNRPRDEKETKDNDTSES